MANATDSMGMGLDGLEMIVKRKISNELLKLEKDVEQQVLVLRQLQGDVPGGGDEESRTGEAPRRSSPGTRIYSCLTGGMVRRPSDGVGQYIPLRCKKWSCPTCCRKNGKKLWARFKKGPYAERLGYLWTLPIKHGEERTWEQSLEESGTILNRFFTSLKKLFPRMPYLWAREIGEEHNLVHFHVMVDRYIPQKLVSKLWDKAGGGFVCWVNRRKPGYALKYLFKVASYPQKVWSALHGKRHWSSSRGLLAGSVRQESKDPPWIMTTGAPWFWAGTVIVGESDGIILFQGG